MTTFTVKLPDGKTATRKSAHPYTHAVAVKWPGDQWWGVFSYHSDRDKARSKMNYLLHCPGNIHQMGITNKSVEVQILETSREES